MKRLLLSLACMLTLAQTPAAGADPLGEIRGQIK